MRELLAAFLLLSCVLTELRSQSRGDFEQHLPAGATFAIEERSVVVSDLDEDGRDEVVMFVVSEPNDAPTRPAVLVFEEKADTYELVWSTSFPDTKGFDKLSGVYRLVPSGPPHIVTYWAIGASCQGALDIFQFREGKYESVAGDWRTETGCQNVVQIEDLDKDGTREIVFKASRQTVVPHIYRWNGNGYVLDRERFPTYYEEGLDQITQAATGPGKYPASARLNWGRQAATILRLQGRYEDAIAFCRRLLLVLDDAQRIMPSSTDVKPGSLAFEREILSAKRELYDLMSEISSSFGRQEEAAGFNRQAEALAARLAK